MTYDDAELIFDTDYDRENPVTKHHAKRRIQKLKAKKKKQELLEKGLSPIDHKLSDHHQVHH